VQEEARGLVFDVQRYSIHDGPGIRTLVFLKGCPLRCLWCCNPESQRAAPEVEFRASLCQRCGRCLAACPLGAINPDLAAPPAAKIDRGRCDVCGACAAACPNGALRLVGRWLTVSQALAEVQRDAAYYRRSGGGVTLSGGEPLAQPAFAAALLRACYERNIHTAVETTGFVAWGTLAKVLPFTDLFLYDLKHVDPRVHAGLTGVSNALILDNARRLVAAGAALTLRLPLIPGYNADEANLAAAAQFAGELGIGEVHLMPFHQLGKDKYGRLGLDYTLGALTGLRDTAAGLAEIRRARDTLAERGLQVHVGG